MDQDEKTQRPPRTAAVRSTAPAGTPYPVAPQSPPPAPGPTESQPRTVGGHTARLVIADDDPLDFDSFPGPRPGRGSPLSDLGSLDGGSAEPPSPSLSATVGGTMRLATVSPDTAAVAKVDVARDEAEKRAAPPAAPAEPSKSSKSSGPPGHASAPKPPPPALTASISGSLGERGSSFLALLFAPASVAVGLVFFAMGSMITLTMEGRFIRLSVSVPSTETTHQTAMAVAPGGPTQPAVASGSTSGSAAASGAPTAPPAAAVAPGAGVGPVPPSAAASAVKPPLPAVTGRPQGGTKLKPLIF